MLGVLTKTTECQSRHGGTAYRNMVWCAEDSTQRTLWVDPKMENYRHWQEIIQISLHTKMRDRGIVLDRLQPLKKNPNNLNADHPPEFVDTIDLDLLKRV
jgi:hypothetical protein